MCTSTNVHPRMYAGGESDRPGRSSEFLHTDALHTHERITIRSYRVSQPWLTAQTLVYALFERTATRAAEKGVCMTGVRARMHPSVRQRLSARSPCTLVDHSVISLPQTRRAACTVTCPVCDAHVCESLLGVHSAAQSMWPVSAVKLHLRPSLTCSAWAGSVLRSRV